MITLGHLYNFGFIGPNSIFTDLNFNLIDLTCLSNLSSNFFCFLYILVSLGMITCRTCSRLDVIQAHNSHLIVDTFVPNIESTFLNKIHCIAYSCSLHSIYTICTSYLLSLFFSKTFHDFIILLYVSFMYFEFNVLVCWRRTAH